ncbi:MAG: tetratricopeptide repeat protein [Planctomycetota bacterium]
MTKIRVNLLPEFLVLFSILIISIFLFITIIKEYMAHKHYIEYQKISNDNRQNRLIPEKQIYLLRKNAGISPSNADAIFELGKSYIDNMPYGKSEEEKYKSYDMAKESFKKSLIYKPTDGRHWARYAWYIGLNGETNEAIECFEKAIYLQKSDVFVHSLYARWCINLVKSEIDLENPVRCVEMNKSLQYNDNRFINNISINSFLERAQIEWDKAISLKPLINDAAFNISAYNSLADLALIKCDFDKAISNYIAGDNKIMIAKCYFIKGNYNEAVNVLDGIINGGGAMFGENLPEIRNLLNNIIKEDSNNYRALYCSGEIYNRLKQQRLALQDFKAVVKLNPKHIDAHLKLAKIYKSNGQSDLAMEEYESIISLNPNHKEAIDLLGEAIRKNN